MRLSKATREWARRIAAEAAIADGTLYDRRAGDGRPVRSARARKPRRKGAGR